MMNLWLLVSFPIFSKVHKFSGVFPKGDRRCFGNRPKSLFLFHWTDYTNSLSAKYSEIWIHVFLFTWGFIKCDERNKDANKTMYLLSLECETRFSLLILVSAMRTLINTCFLIIFNSRHWEFFNGILWLPPAIWNRIATRTSSRIKLSSYLMLAGRSYTTLFFISFYFYVLYA